MWAWALAPRRTPAAAAGAKRAAPDPDLSCSGGAAWLQQGGAPDPEAEAAEALAALQGPLQLLQPLEPNGEPASGRGKRAPNPTAALLEGRAQELAPAAAAAPATPPRSSGRGCKRQKTESNSGSDSGNGESSEAAKPIGIETDPTAAAPEAVPTAPAGARAGTPLLVATPIDLPPELVAAWLAAQQFQAASPGVAVMPGPLLLPLPQLPAPSLEGVALLYVPHLAACPGPASPRPRAPVAPAPAAAPATPGPKTPAPIAAAPATLAPAARRAGSPLQPHQPQQPQQPRRSARAPRVTGALLACQQQQGDAALKDACNARLPPGGAGGSGSGSGSGSAWGGGKRRRSDGPTADAAEAATARRSSSASSPPAAPAAPAAAVEIAPFAIDRAPPTEGGCRPAKSARRSWLGP
jgi:hypothetical protein